MADWQYKLELKDLWQAHDNEEITIHELAKAVANKANILQEEIERRFPDEAAELENDIIPLFEEVAELVDEMDFEDFDNALHSLYDWADTHLGKGRKLCRIETF